MHSSCHPSRPSLTSTTAYGSNYISVGKTLTFPIVYTIVSINVQLLGLDVPYVQFLLSELSIPDFALVHLLEEIILCSSSRIAFSKNPRSSLTPKSPLVSSTTFCLHTSPHN